MNIIDRIEKGEFSLVITDMVTIERNINYFAVREIFRLAKLGAAAEKGFNQDGNFPCEKVFKGLKCDEPDLCGWNEFCKLRAEEK
jgi:hypothetical protein